MRQKIRLSCVCVCVCAGKNQATTYMRGYDTEAKHLCVCVCIHARLRVCAYLHACMLQKKDGHASDLGFVVGVVCHIHTCMHVSYTHMHACIPITHACMYPIHTCMHVSHTHMHACINYNRRYCNTAILQHCNTATLQHCNTATLQHCNTATLQHCNTATDLGLVVGVVCQLGGEAVCLCPLDKLLPVVTLYTWHAHQCE
jgi:hypothetical protein